MGHFETEYAGSDGTDFWGQGWEPDQDPRAAVVLVHGQGEHTGRYGHVGAAFTDAGFALMGFDLRGHGRSGGARGDSPSYSALMDDVGRSIAEVHGRYAGLPLFLYGHSLGGNLVINYLLRRQPTELKGAIATGPWLRLSVDLPPARIRLARFMRRVWPGMTQNSGLDQGALSRDPAVVAAYSADPLVHDKLSVRHFMSVYESGLWALEHASELQTRLLLMHGTADRVTSPAASREFAEKAGERVEFRPWEGLYHELHNEPEKREVLTAMVDSVTDRLER